MTRRQNIKDMRNLIKQTQKTHEKAVKKLGNHKHNRSTTAKKRKRSSKPGSQGGASVQGSSEENAGFSEQSEEGAGAQRLGRNTGLGEPGGLGNQQPDQLPVGGLHRVQRSGLGEGYAQDKPPSLNISGHVNNKTNEFIPGAMFRPPVGTDPKDWVPVVKQPVVKQVVEEK